MTRVLIVIPARLESKRLAEKPLQPLGDSTLVGTVVQRVCGLEMKGLEVVDVIVATDSDRVGDVLHDVCVYTHTDSAFRNGTERVAGVMSTGVYNDVDVVVNVQGDQPFVTAEQIQAAVFCVHNLCYDVGTTILPLFDKDACNRNVVKVLTAELDCLAFARVMTWRNDCRNGWKVGEHVGVYAYTPEVLQRWATAEETRLERVLRLEQVRALHLGMEIGGAYTYPALDARSFSIDDARDLKKARQRLAYEVVGVDAE